MQDDLHPGQVDSQLCEPADTAQPGQLCFGQSLPQQAAAIGDCGEIMVLNMGEPVRIVDLAKALITLSGAIPDEDVEIVFITA